MAFWNGVNNITELTMIYKPWKTASGKSTFKTRSLFHSFFLSLALYFVFTATKASNILTFLFNRCGSMSGLHVRQLDFVWNVSISVYCNYLNVIFHNMTGNVGKNNGRLCPLRNILVSWHTHTHTHVDVNDPYRSMFHFGAHECQRLASSRIKYILCMNRISPTASSNEKRNTNTHSEKM